MDGNGCSWRRGLVLAVMVISMFPCCRKPSEAVKSDLQKAGYQLTSEDLFRASRSNEVSSLKKFASSGFHLDSRDAAGDTALHAAAAAGAKEAADFLLDHGLAVDSKGALDRTPLMSAVLAGDSRMIAWLLRQKASPDVKDNNGFTPLMLAVREGRPGPVAELAPYSMNGLDSAILMAALEGKTQVIDTLTNYGASIYAKMEDERTPLMVAAQNGHAETVRLLLDLGSSRLSVDAAGHTAAELATEAGHPEIAALLERDPLPGEIALDSPEDVAISMDARVLSSSSKGASEQDLSGNPNTPSIAGFASPAKTIEGAVVSPAVDRVRTLPMDSKPLQATPDTPTKLPPLVMRQYRERALPIQVVSVQGEVATFRVMGTQRREIHVRAGEPIPGTRLQVVRMHRRMEDSKVNPGNTVEISVVEVKDTGNGSTREWIAGLSANAHDPAALIEDTATGQRYSAVPGQRFKSRDGGEFLISEVRPNQIVVKNVRDSAVSTLPLRGPRG